MPGVVAAAGDFLRSPEGPFHFSSSFIAPPSRFAVRLDNFDSNLWHWMKVTSTAGLHDLVDVCIARCLSNKLAPTLDQLQALPPGLAAKLLQAAWTKMNC